MAHDHTASSELNGISNAVMTVGVNTANLKPGTYSGNIAIVVGHQSTQSVAVELTIQQPPPPSAPIIVASPLNISASLTLGQQDPPGQPVTITNTGGGLLNWSTSVNTSTAPWLRVSPAGGTIAPRQTGQLQVNISGTNLSPGAYVGRSRLTVPIATISPLVGTRKRLQSLLLCNLPVRWQLLRPKRLHSVLFKADLTRQPNRLH